jgi:N-acyl-D-glutamate deacylase
MMKSRKFDLVINNGRVIDPETKLDEVRHIGINGGTIAAVSEAPLTGKQVIDATGLVVAPGYIDLSSHAQSIPSDRIQAFDEVTTALELESDIMPIGRLYDSQAGNRTSHQLRRFGGLDFCSRG